eukprot:gene19026-20939_t
MSETNITNVEHNSNSSLSSLLSSCYTTTVWRLILTDAQRYAIAISSGLTIPSIIVVNFLLCVALVKTKQVGSPAKFLFFFLSVSDFVSGVVTIPVGMMIFTTFGRMRCCWFERLSMFVGQTNGHFSLYLILAIAAQRYVKIKHPLKTHFLATKRGSWLLLFACLIWSICHGVVSTYFFGFVTSKVPNIFMMIMRFLIAITIYCCYFLLYRSVKQQVAVTAKWSKSASTAGNASGELTKTNNRLPRFFKTVLLILVALLFCYFPVIVMDLWTGYYTLIKGTAAPQWIRFLYYLVHALLFLNSSLNAAIYVYRNQDCKDCIKGIFTCKTQKVKTINNVSTG